MSQSGLREQNLRGQIIEGIYILYLKIYGEITLQIWLCSVVYDFPSSLSSTFSDSVYRVITPDFDTSKASGNPGCTSLWDKLKVYDVLTLIQRTRARPQIFFHVGGKLTPERNPPQRVISRQ